MFIRLFLSNIHIFAEIYTFKCGVMLKEERHRYIIERIGRDNRVYVTGLSEELNVSDDTLRRDLVELERLGLLTKVHGGAVLKSNISLQFTERLNTATLIKQQMAAKLVPLFEEGDVILIDGGTSNLEVAPSPLRLSCSEPSSPRRTILILKWHGGCLQTSISPSILIVCL